MITINDFSERYEELANILDPGTGNPERHGVSKSLYWKSEFARAICEDLEEVGVECSMHKKSRQAIRIEVKVYAPEDYQQGMFLSKDALLEWSAAKHKGFKTILWGPDYKEPTIVEFYKEIKLHHAIKLAWKMGSKLSRCGKFVFALRGEMLGNTIGITE